MLVIRNEQMAAFSQYMIRQFERSAMAHLCSTYPKRAQEKGESDLRDLIRSGIERAAGYAIKVEDEVLIYIECMIVLGTDFDTDSSFPWASEILSDKSIGVDEKTRRLKKHLDQYLEVK